MGWSKDAIAHRLGCTTQCIRLTLRRKPIRTELRCIYPALEAWRQKEGLTLSRMCLRAGLDASIAHKLSGQKNPERLSLEHIICLLNMTGMTFEEVFGGVELD